MSQAPEQLQPQSNSLLVLNEVPTESAQDEGLEIRVRAPQDSALQLPPTSPPQCISLLPQPRLPVEHVLRHMGTRLTAFTWILSSPAHNLTIPIVQMQTETGVSEPFPNLPPGHLSRHKLDQSTEAQLGFCETSISMTCCS